MRLRDINPMRLPRWADGGRTGKRKTPRNGGVGGDSGGAEGLLAQLGEQILPVSGLRSRTNPLDFASNRFHSTQ